MITHLTAEQFENEAFYSLSTETEIFSLANFDDEDEDDEDEDFDDDDEIDEIEIEEEVEIEVESDEDEDFDFLVCLDTDIIIADDFSLFFDESKVCAKPVDQDPLTIDSWKKLFAYFGLEMPQERYLTSFHMKETIPYFNIMIRYICIKYMPKLKSPKLDSNGILILFIL